MEWPIETATPRLTSPRTAEMAPGSSGASVTMDVVSNDGYLHAAGASGVKRDACATLQAHRGTHTSLRLSMPPTGCLRLSTLCAPWQRGFRNGPDNITAMS
mgnify:CR=1 FL=1